MWFSKTIYKYFILVILGWTSVFVTATETTIIEDGSTSSELVLLTLEKAIETAQQRDPWLVGNRYTEDAIEAMSIVAGTLPDPKISISTVNIPLDSFDLDQENMTNIFKIGISQTFPRGDTLVIRKRQLKLDASQYPYLRQDHKAKLKVVVSHLWLDIYKAQQSIALIEQDRDLFEQLVDVAEISYSSAFGMTRQQDIIRAQLELTRLDDRLVKLHQQQEMFQQRLSEWLSDYFTNRYSEENTGVNTQRLFNLKLSKQLPNIELVNSELYNSTKVINHQQLFSYFKYHPVVIALEQKIKTSRAGINLAKQKYKPEWGANASYGYRSNDPRGNERADFLSMGITFDIPLFTANRQDKELESAIFKTESIKTTKWILLRNLIASFETAKSALFRLNQRQSLYKTQLLPQMNEQAEASLTAYTNNEGDFSEVVRSRIADLNAEIDTLHIDVEKQKTIVQLNYFFTIANEVNGHSDNRLGEQH